MNTQEVVKKIQLIGGSLALLTAAGFFWGISKGLKYRQKYKREFDPDKIETLEGRILEVLTNSEQDDMSQGVIVILQTEDEKIIPVHLGPEWYLSHQKKIFKDGDRVKVVGSRVNYQNNPVIIAAHIKRGNSELILRDEDGWPRWKSWVS